MARTKQISTQRAQRTNRSRSVFSGSATRPRLAVFRSNTSLEAQLINDDTGVTICAVHSREIKTAKNKDRSPRVAVAYEAGKALAEKAKKKKITEVVFDRRGAKYHGRIAAFAEGAREGGLTF